MDLDKESNKKLVFNCSTGKREYIEISADQKKLIENIRKQALEDEKNIEEQFVDWGGEIKLLKTEIAELRSTIEKSAISTETKTNVT